jgi:hypothetical protein
MRHDSLTPRLAWSTPIVRGYELFADLACRAMLLFREANRHILNVTPWTGQLDELHL